MPRSSLKCFICVVLSVVALWMMAFSHLIAQTTEGNEFWLVFQKNFRDSIADDRTNELRPAEPLKLGITITAREHAKGYIEAPGYFPRMDFELRAGEITTMDIDAALQLISSGTIERKTVHVVSDAPISVYAFNHRYQTTDTYLSIPVEALGMTYRAVGYKWLADDLLSQFAVVSTEDNTTVTITPATGTKDRKPARVPFTVVLNRGEVYQVMQQFDPMREDDLTGSLIAADKPIAVFSGHNCAYVPERTWKACNLLVEQLPPFETWGTEFVVGGLADRPSSVIRVVAHRDQTDVFENGKPVATLEAGRFYENSNLGAPTVVTASQPVQVVQYSKGFTAPSPRQSRPDSVGDPMMLMIPPTDQYLASYRFATPFKGSWEHYVNITTLRNHAQDIRLDGHRIPQEKFKPIPGSDFVLVQLQVDHGTHLVKGKGEFGLYSYGFGFEDKIFDAYGNNCGQGLAHHNRWMPEPRQEPSISQSRQAGREAGKDTVTAEAMSTDDAIDAPGAVKLPDAPEPVKSETPQAPVKTEKDKPGIEYREE